MFHKISHKLMAHIQGDRTLNRGEVTGFHWNQISCDIHRTLSFMLQHAEIP
jgi:hypothetical protein